jgi:phosphoglycerate kinase
VPLDENFNVTDATRIEAAKPTIDAILKQGGSVLMSHLGRPKVDAQFSLKHILNTTADVLGVQFASNCIGAEAKRQLTNCNQAKFAFRKLAFP